MSPGKIDVPQAAVGAVNPVFRLILFVVLVGVQLEVLGVDDLVRLGAAYREGIAHYGPLRLAEKAKHLAHIMEKSRQHHPVGMAITADSL